MSTLNVNTINEATASAGVTIDELVGIDQEESSDFAVPGLGIYATLTILCLSAILAKRD